MKIDQERSDLSHNDKSNLSDPSNYAVTLFAEQIKLLYLQANKALIASLLVSLACVVVFWERLPQSMLIGWFAAIIVLSATRFLLIISYHRKKPSAVESIRWGYYFIATLGKL